MSDMTSEVLLLGPEGSGKTLLLKHLQHYLTSNPPFTLWSRDRDLPQHLSTVGTNIVTLELIPPSSTATVASQPPTAAPRARFSLREVGGAMGPIWDSYFESARAVVYVIDASNPFQIAAATVLLRRLLEHKALAKLPFLIVFAKADVKGQITLTHFKNMMGWDKLTANHVPRLCAVSQFCALDGTGLPHVYRWIYNLHSVQV